RISKLIALISLTCILAISLISCGGGGGSSDTTTPTSTSAQRTGTVGILLTDKPADPSLFVAMNATIERIGLIGSDNGDEVTLFSDEPQTIDLLSLKNESIPFTFRDDVPVGTYCKIRLILSDLELVLADDTPDDLTDNETYHPNLPGNGKLDLLARDCFTVEEGNVITVQVDMDGGNSIHITENNNGYNFRPVVFVDVLEEGFESKLVRLEGEITEVMPDENSLLICDALPMQQTESMECVEIKLGDDTAFFDNLNYNGEPRSLDELLLEENLGEMVMVVGWPDHQVMHHVDVDIPPGHLPPPGECRLWMIGEPPGLQSSPGDCELLEEQITEVSVLVDHDGVVSDRYHPLMEVDALVIELGDFLQVEGEVATEADSSGFGMNVTEGGSVVTAGPLDVMFHQDEPGINGTRIVSKSGDILDYLEVTVPRTVQVDGVLDLTGAEAVLKAALVIIDTTTEENDQQITGTILSIGANGFVLSPEEDTVCGIATTDLTVTYADGVDFLTVVITDTVSEITPDGTLDVGQDVGINGSCSADGYIAESVVILDDQRIP
ncbi:MAG: DUF4382 domain-containing protein, partial [Candidatus Thiodiazotropha endolucinida]|nr:DUF4382 domain-containing protein [Candidatus Thiodiazotropha taylori]MCW4344607.1 DUF4382 domain-containing protein [Candidatus Thiodiazotropha endolucinida]